MNTENNILIAEFMGRKFQAFYENRSYNKEFETYSECQSFIDTLSEKGYTPQIGWNLGCGLYHESWDWLMPVVEKIETTVSETNIYFNGNHSCIIEMGLDVQIRAFGDSKMEATYTAVVEFITWYNKQQPQK